MNERYKPSEQDILEDIQAQKDQIEGWLGEWSGSYTAPGNEFSPKQAAAITRLIRDSGGGSITTVAIDDAGLGHMLGPVTDYLEKQGFSVIKVQYSIR